MSFVSVYPYAPAPLQKLASLEIDALNGALTVVKVLQQTDHGVVELVSVPSTGSPSSHPSSHATFFLVRKTYRKRGLRPIDIVNVRREMTLHMEISHPCIVSCYAVGESAGEVFLYCEFMDGGDLFSELYERKSSFLEGGLGLPERRTSHVIASVLEALQYLHERKMLHRDIKLENILTSKNGAVKIADMGFLIAGEVERPTTCLGTLVAMSPEILRAGLTRTGKSEHAYGPEVDIWACGVMMFELLCRQPPFEGDTFREVLADIERKGVRFPSRAYVSAHATDFLARCMAVHAPERATAAALLQHPFVTQYRAVPRIRSSLTSLQKASAPAVATPMPPRGANSSLRQLIVPDGLDKPTPEVQGGADCAGTVPCGTSRISGKPFPWASAASKLVRAATFSSASKGNGNAGAYEVSHVSGLSTERGAMVIGSRRLSNACARSSSSARLGPAPKPGPPLTPQGSRAALFPLTDSTAPVTVTLHRPVNVMGSKSPTAGVSSGPLSGDVREACGTASTGLAGHGYGGGAGSALDVLPSPGHSLSLATRGPAPTRASSQQTLTAATSRISPGSDVHVNVAQGPPSGSDGRLLSRLTSLFGATRRHQHLGRGAGAGGSASGDISTAKAAGVSGSDPASTQLPQAKSMQSGGAPRSKNTAMFAPDGAAHRTAVYRLTPALSAANNGNVNGLGPGRPGSISSSVAPSAQACGAQEVQTSASASGAKTFQSLLD